MTGSRVGLPGPPPPERGRESRARCCRQRRRSRRRRAVIARWATIVTATAQTVTAIRRDADAQATRRAPGRCCPSAEVDMLPGNASDTLLRRGDVAEWLRSGLQSRVHRFDSGRRLSTKASQAAGLSLAAIHHRDSPVSQRCRRTAAVTATVRASGDPAWRMGAVSDAVAPTAAAAAAVAAWLSAWNSRQAVARAHRPFVYAEPEMRSVGPDFDHHEEHRPVETRLRNDGAGVALDLRLRLEAERGPWRGEPTLPVRAMRAGEVVPPDVTPARGGTRMEKIVTGYQRSAPPREVDARAVVVRFEDPAGERWEVRNRRHPPGPLMMRRLRSGRLDLWRPRRGW